MRTRYWFQLTPTQRSELGFYARGIVRNKVMVDPDTFRPVKSGGKPMRLFDLLMAERKLEPGNVGWQRRNAIVTAINRIVFDVFNYPINEKRAEDKRLGRADLAELRVHVLRILDAWHLPPSEERGKQSFGTALQRLVDGASEQYADFGSLVRYLGLGRRGSRKFRYEIEIELLELVEFDDKETQQAYDTAKGAWKLFKKILEEAAKKKSEAFAKYKSVSKYLPLTYLVGHATVSFKGVVAYADPNDEPAEGEKADPPWTAEFGIALAGINVSRGAGAGTSIEWSGVSEIWHATPPTKEDLEGTIGYVQGDAFTGSKGEIKDENGEVEASWGGAFGGSKSFLAFYGRNFEAPLTFWFDGELAKGKGAGVGGKSLLGTAWLLAGQDADIDLAPKGKVLRKFDTYWRSRIAQVGVHFPINGARLPVPTEPEEDLMRAENLLTVKQALDAFAACELPLIAHPLAVVQLDGYADPPHNPTDNQRLSENRALSVRNYLMGTVGQPLTLGLPAEKLHDRGRVPVKGHGEPDDGVPEGKEQFDPALRRVDVTVFIRKSMEKFERRDNEAESTVKLMPPKIK